MDKKSKILILIFFALVVISIVFIFYRYIIIKDIIFYTDEELFNESLLEE